METGAPVFGCVIKANTQAKVVGVPAALAMQERQDDRIELIDAADVFDVSIKFVPESEIQGELGMDAPVVLNETRQVGAISIWNKQWLSRFAAPQRDRKEEIVVIDLAVAIAIEVRKILDHFNAARLEYA